MQPVERSPETAGLELSTEMSLARATLDLAEAHLIGRTGLIQDVRQILTLPGDPRIFSATCIPADVGCYLGADIEGHSGAVGFSWEEASAAAVGECVERYCCASYAWDELVHASLTELGCAGVGMDEMQLYSAAQYEHPAFPFMQWREDTPIYWTPGESLLSGRSRHIPAALVYIPYRPRRPECPTDFVGLSVSSGQACAATRTRAVLSGLYEVVERDAFMIRWVRRLAPTRIDFLKSPALAEMYERYFAGCNLHFEVFDLTLDIAIPTVLGVARSESAGGTVLAVGAASDLSEEEAIAKALKESYQSIVWARELRAKRPSWRPAPDYANVRDFEDHVRLYAEPDMARHLDFILNSAERRSPRPAPAFEGVEDELDGALAAVERVGLDAVVVDTTSPEIAELGLHCPKVFLPGAVQLTAAHGMPAYGADRLYEVPGRLGFTAPIHREFNPVPHPFP